MIEKCKKELIAHRVTPSETSMSSTPLMHKAKLFDCRSGDEDNEWHEFFCFEDFKTLKKSQLSSN